MNRIVYTTAVIFILLFFAPVCSAKTLNFSVGSDLHFSEIDVQNTKGALTPKILSCFIDRMNEEKPDFVVFLGDNTDKSKTQAVTSFLERIRRIKRPYYIILGNHDSYKYSGLSRENYAKLVSQHSKTQKNYKSNFYFRPTEDITVIGIDSTSLGMPGTHGYFSSETLQWLDDMLKKNKNRKVILLQHVPYIEPAKDNSRNILNKSDYEAVIKKYDNILMIVSGHYHYFAVKEDEKGTFHISAPALVDAPYDYLNIEVKYDKVPFVKAKNFKINVEKKPSL